MFMFNHPDPRIKILLVSIITVLIFGFVGIIWAIKSESGSGSGSGVQGTPKLVLETSKFAFGDVSMFEGLAVKTIRIANEGDGDLKISKMLTSCMCTEAVLIMGNKRSPAFGMPGHGGGSLTWSQTLKPGESGELEITFDPLAHGLDATGPITRVVEIYSNDGGQDGTRSVVTFSGNVVK